MSEELGDDVQDTVVQAVAEEAAAEQASKGGANSIDAMLKTEADQQIAEDHKLASELREAAMRAVPGLIDVDLHAELFDGAAGCHVDLGTISSPNDERLPANMRLPPPCGGAALSSYHDP